MKLDLSRRGLVVLPDDIFGYPEVSHLMLGWNKLSTIDPRINRLANLTHLYVHDNPLPDLPPEICGLSRLKVLDTSHNRALATLPAELHQLQDLRFLYAAELSLTRAPKLPISLEYLNLGDNQLTEFTATNLLRLQELRLQHNNIAVLPADFGALENLRELHLDNNPLTALPSSTSRLTDLRTLSLRNCRLSQLPDLSRLNKLHSLDLRANLFTELPDWLTQLPQLERLDLRWNGFDLPPTNLQSLVERGCRIYC